MENKFMSNLIWRFAERFGAQVITFIVSIVLARLLVPEMYGTIALVMVFINVLQVFIDSGLGNALIQKKNADETDFSTVFYFNMFICICLYVGMYIAAPFIAQFYSNQSMTKIIRVIGIILIISGVKNVQQAYVSRNMLFKKFFFSTLGGTIFSAVIGVFLAYTGAGVWALVAQHVSNVLIDTIILWITVKWRPKLIFSFERFKVLFSFGWKLLISGLIDTFYNNLRDLIIGKKYNASSLAYYTNGQKIPGLVVGNINTAIGSVLFPTLSKEQDDKENLKQHVRRAIQVSSYVIWPVMLGIAACSKSLITVLLTEKWAPTVPFLQIACIVCGFLPIHTTNLQVINAIGRSDIFLKLEIIKKAIGLGVLLVSMKYGVMAIALSAILTEITSAFINSYPNTKLLNYSRIEQIKDVAPSFILSIVMCAIVLQMNNLEMKAISILCIQIILGVTIYLAGSILFKFDSFNYILNNMRKYRR